MNQLAKKKRVPRKRDVPASKDRESQDKPTKERLESDDIERAVYDGMQDLRVEKPK